MKQFLTIFVVCYALSGCTYEVSRSTTTIPTIGCTAEHHQCTTSCEHQYSHNRVNREGCYENCALRLNSCQARSSQVIIQQEPTVVVEPFASTIVEPYPYWGWRYGGGWGYRGGWHHHHWR